MNTSDILDQIFGSAKESEKDSVPESEEDKTKSMDCMLCGGEDSVEFDPDYVHVNKELKLEIPAEARICDECGHVFFESGIFQKLLEAEEKARGRPYVRFELKNGQLSKYSLH